MAMSNDDYQMYQAAKQAFDEQKRKQEQASLASYAQQASLTSYTTTPSGGIPKGSLLRGTGAITPPTQNGATTPGGLLNIGPISLEQFTAIKQVVEILQYRIDRRWTPNGAEDVVYVILGEVKPTIDQNNDWQQGYDEGYEDGQKPKE